ncbi:Transcription initiation factor IIA subunit 2 [Elasticomyces elasticus]|nr:Transcription initiation factor IIA subunit 2 [Elasticomyces elasticus]KAK4965879.1 Transcription initiation factor IIA subunit 2 [Elasticomyces elasticus]
MSAVTSNTTITSTSAAATALDAVGSTAALVDTLQNRSAITTMANANQNFYELYRSTSIGQTLADTLDELISSRRIEPQLAMRVMQNFDQNIAAVLGEKVKSRLNFKGHLDTYRFCDEVWTFIIKDVTFKMVDTGQQERADRVKIVACQSKDKPEK